MISPTLTPGPEVRSPLRPPLVSAPMTSGSGPSDLLAELERVSLLRVGLQERLEAVFEERWSR